MKHMKKIAFLVSGNIRIYEKNLIFLHNLKKKFSNYKIIFISLIWENKNDKDNFKDKYEIEFINEIKQKIGQKILTKLNLSQEMKIVHGRLIISFICGMQ